MHAIVRVCCRRGPRIVIAPRDGLLAQIDRHGHRAATAKPGGSARAAPHCHQSQQAAATMLERLRTTVADATEVIRKRLDRPKDKYERPVRSKIKLIGAALAAVALSTFKYHS